MRRCLLLSLALLAATAPDALALNLADGPKSPGWTRATVAPAPNPLTGTGTGFKIVANLPIDNTTDYAASDIEMHGNHAFIGSYSTGMVIADISDPTQPKVAGTFKCGGGSQYDVQLSADGNLALLTTDSTGASCLKPDQSGSMVIDVSDRSSPRLIGFIPTAVGSHTHTLDDRTLYINNYPASYSKLEVFDLADPAKPAKVAELGFNGEDSVHDSIVDHRPDGRSLLYAASIGFTDVIDVTDNRKPKLLQRLADPAVTISHQAEPNHARDTLIVTDEFLGGQNFPACGQLPVRLGEGVLPTVGDPTDLGALHFYKLAKDGTMVDNGTGEGKIGTYNIPVTLNPNGGCTVHVFWQAPDQNRLVTAWYGQGTHVVDFTDPAAPRTLGSFIPTNADTWAAKPHRVGGKSYVFTGDIVRGMDVLEFTGSGWPAGAIEQNVQRAQIMGVKPSTPGKATKPSKKASKVRGFLFRAKVRVPGARSRRTTLTVSFYNAKKRLVSKLRYRVRGGSRTIKARVGGLAGRYRYVVRVGDKGRVLKRGTVRVKRSQATAARDLAGRTLVCRVVT